jgi:dihydrofolate reductase
VCGAGTVGLREGGLRRIVYDVAVTLDGYIAGPGDDISAFPADGDHVTAYRERLQGYTTVVMGRRTYESGYRFGLRPGARAYPHMDHHVFSRTIALPAARAVEVVRDGWREALEALRRGPGGDIYLCGGGTFAGLVASAGLLDRLRAKRVPVVQGAGVPLFAGLARPLRLRRLAIEPYESGVELVEYAIAVPGASE